MLLDFNHFDEVETTLQLYIDDDVPEGDVDGDARCLLNEDAPRSTEIKIDDE